MCTALRKSQYEVSNEGYYKAGPSVSSRGHQHDGGVWGGTGGCVFQVGSELYFVPTKQVWGDDVLYITCDAQKIEGAMDGWRSQLALGDIANGEVEDAILDHLQVAPTAKHGEAFVFTRNGKTFRL